MFFIFKKKEKKYLCTFIETVNKNKMHIYNGGANARRFFGVKDEYTHKTKLHALPRRKQKQN